MINEKILEGKNYCWLEEVSGGGLRDVVTKGNQYNEVQKFFEQRREEIEEAGYKFENFINSIIMKNGTIHVVKKERKIIKKLVYVENIERLDWENLIEKDLKDKSVFIIPENIL